MSSVKSNTEIIFDEIPTGFPEATKHFKIRKGEIDLDEPLGTNEILLKTLYASVDSYMLQRLRNPSIQSYLPAVIVGQPMEGSVVAEVIKSNNPKYAIGDIVIGMGKWAEYFVNHCAQKFGGFLKIPNGMGSLSLLSYNLSVFGIPGLTAYVGLHKICEPLTPGQTVYVSAAAGAVGHIVCQYGKALGLRVVGSAGNDKKVQWLLDLGVDAAFNYKTHEDFDAILKETCPNGIDIYFENVGGKILDAVLQNCNEFARIAVSGMISQYHRAENPEGNYALLNLISKRIRMQGFMCIDKEDMDKYGIDFIKVFSELIQEGKMNCKEDISEGIHALPEAFVGMLHGKNIGRAIVHVNDL